MFGNKRDDDEGEEVEVAIDCDLSEERFSS